MNAHDFENDPQPHPADDLPKHLPNSCAADEQDIGLPLVEQLQLHVRNAVGPQPHAHLQVDGAPQSHGTAQYIRQILKARRQRDAYFGCDLFADPAWDILLEIYAADVSQQKISVSAACVAAAVPATTALRWLVKLEQAGILVRSADHLDGRRYWVQLSSSATDAMHRYLGRFAVEGMPI